MRTVTIVAEDHATTVDFVEAVDAARADAAVTEIRLIEGGRLRRVWRRDGVTRAAGRSNDSGDTARGKVPERR